MASISLLLLTACASSLRERVVEAEPIVIDAIEVSIHPAVGSILTVGWDQSQAGEVRAEYRFDDEEWSTTPSATYPIGRNERMLLGIPYAADVEIRLVSGEVVTTVIAATTGTLPTTLAVPSVLVSEPDGWDPADRYLLGSVSTGSYFHPQTFWSFILDRKGRVVWARETLEDRTTKYVHRSQDGRTLLFDESTYWSELDRGAGSVVRRATIDLAELEVQSTPGLHHGFVELPDGVLAWGDATSYSEVLRVASQEEALWDCSSLGENFADGCMWNSLTWSKATDSFLASSFSHDTVVEIDRQTGDTVRVIGTLAPGHATFDPADSQFSWQHGAVYTESGTLLLSTEAASAIGTSATETVVREYAIAGDHLEEVWSFGEGEGVYAAYGGTVERLANGNTLHGMGVASRVREITPEGEVVWDLDWALAREVGRVSFLGDLYALVP